MAIDGDHSGGEYFPPIDCCERSEWRARIHIGAQRYVAIGVVPEGSHVQLLSSPLGAWYASPPFADGGGATFGENPHIAVVEFYVTPFDFLFREEESQSQVSGLYPGKIIGVNISINDIDEGNRKRGGIFYPDIHSTHTLSNVFESFFSADFFVDALLVGKGAEDSGDTAVEDLSWARIKASLAE